MWMRMGWVREDTSFKHNSAGHTYIYDWNDEMMKLYMNESELG